MHTTTGFTLTNSDKITVMMDSLKHELKQLTNKTNIDVIDTEKANETFSRQLFFFDDVEKEVDTSFGEINSRMANTSYGMRIKRVLKDATESIKRKLHGKYEPNEETSVARFNEYEKHMNYTEYNLGDIFEDIIKAHKKIKRIVWKSPEEELVEILFGAKYKLQSLMEDKLLEFKNLVASNHTDSEDLGDFMDNNEYKINEIMNETISDTEVAMSEINITLINRMFLDPTDVVEHLNSVFWNISESIRFAKQEIMETRTDGDRVKKFEELKMAVLSSFCDMVDSIIKVHPIWASMTLAIMFAPGLVFGLNACMIKRDETRMVGKQKYLGRCGEKFIYFFLFPALTFCFPFGILFSQVSEIFITATGDEALIASINYVTNMAMGFEAFLESAPQIILQMYIVFSSGIVSKTQIISILFSIVMLSKTTIMYDLMGTERTVMITVVYLLTHLPMYLCSGYFRLGTITLSCIFFGYWAILPIFLLFCFLFHEASQEMLFSRGDSAVLAVSNLFVVSIYLC